MREREKVRAARRGVAMEIADWMVGQQDVGNGLVGEDRERYEAAWADIKDEMLRRAGIDPDTKSRYADPRQRTLDDYIAEIGEREIA